MGIYRVRSEARSGRLQLWSWSSRNRRSRSGVESLSTAAPSGGKKLFAFSRSFLSLILLRFMSINEGSIMSLLLFLHSDDGTASVFSSRRCQSSSSDANFGRRWAADLRQRLFRPQGSFGSEIASATRRRDCTVLNHASSLSRALLREFATRLCGFAPLRVGRRGLTPVRHAVHHVFRFSLSCSRHECSITFSFWERPSLFATRDGKKSPMQALPV